jgi:hypothetical protein
MQQQQRQHLLQRSKQARARRVREKQRQQARPGDRARATTRSTGAGIDPYAGSQRGTRKAAPLAGEYDDADVVVIKQE